MSKGGQSSPANWKQKLAKEVIISANKKKQRRSKQLDVSKSKKKQQYYSNSTDSKYERQCHSGHKEIRMEGKVHCLLYHFFHYN